MGARERIENTLAPLGIYSLQCPVLAGEAAAYGAAIDLLTAQCDNIRREMFAVTAQDGGLTRMERMLGLEEKELSAEERRERILALCSRTPGQTDTMKFLEELLRLLGENYSITYEPENYAVRITHSADFSMDDLTQAADYAVNYGPAFTRFITDMPMYTWAQIEALDMTFFDIREKGIPWGFFDETL